MTDFKKSGDPAFSTAAVDYDEASSTFSVDNTITKANKKLVSKKKPPTAKAPCDPNDEPCQLPAKVVPPLHDVPELEAWKKKQALKGIPD